MTKLPELGGGEKLIRAMAKRKCTFYNDVFPYTLYLFLGHFEALYFCSVLLFEDMKKVQNMGDLIVNLFISFVWECNWTSSQKRGYTKH